MGEIPAAGIYQRQVPKKFIYRQQLQVSEPYKFQDFYWATLLRADMSHLWERKNHLPSYL